MIDSDKKISKMRLCKIDYDLAQCKFGDVVIALHNRVDSISGVAERVINLLLIYTNPGHVGVGDRCNGKRPNGPT